MIKSHDESCHSYTDDTELYISLTLKWSQSCKFCNYISCWRSDTFFYSWIWDFDTNSWSQMWNFFQRDTTNSEALLASYCRNVGYSGYKFPFENWLSYYLGGISDKSKVKAFSYHSYPEMLVHNTIFSRSSKQFSSQCWYIHRWTVLLQY